MNRVTHHINVILLQQKRGGYISSDSWFGGFDLNPLIIVGVRVIIFASFIQSLLRVPNTCSTRFPSPAHVRSLIFNSNATPNSAEVLIIITLLRGIIYLIHSRSAPNVNLPHFISLREIDCSQKALLISTQWNRKSTMLQHESVKPQNIYE